MSPTSDIGLHSRLVIDPAIVVTGFYRQEARSSATACRSPPSPPAEGTPLYVYSAATIAERYRAIDEAFAGASARDPLRAQGQLDAGDHAAAARPRQQRRRQLRRRNRRRDARRLHPAADRLHRRRQDRRGARAGDRSRREDHQRRVGGGARAHRRARRASGSTRARVAIRINPDVDAQSHPHISTGLKINKFGIAIDAVRASCAGSSPPRDGLEIVGLHATSDRRSRTSIRCAAAEALVELARELATTA